MSITSEELAKTIRRELHFTPTESEALALAAALGIEVEDPKPEPGVYLTGHGDVLIVSALRHEGFPDVLWVVGENGDGNAHNVDSRQAAATWHPLTPARVVPAEPVDHKVARGEAWNRHLDKGWNDWYFHDTFKAGWDAALAKYGHGVA